MSTAKTQTQSIETPADPETVFAIVSDPARLPEWAPAFADVVEATDPGGWRVIKDGQVVPVRVVTDASSRTTDYLRQLARGREGGAYIRVIPGPAGGSVIVMTLPIAPGGDSAAVAQVLRDELSALAGLARTPNPA